MHKTKDLTTVPGGGNGAATKFDPATAYQMAGSDSTDFKTSRIVIHQGDISERDYGPQPKGTLIAHDTKQPLTNQNIRFVVISAWKEYIRWSENRAGGQIYHTSRLSDVPPEDLRWHDKSPPKCIVYYNFAVLVEGEALPMVLSMKNSERHTRVFAETLHKCESARVAMKKTRGLYGMKVVDASNDKGRWKAPMLVQLGDAAPEALAEAVSWSRTAFATAVNNVEAEEEGGAPPESTLFEYAASGRPSGLDPSDKGYGSAY